MKLDLNSAWTRAMKMLGRNRELIAILAGLFLFLPLAALFTVLTGSNIAFPEDGDQDAMAAAMELLLARYWWMFLLVGVAQIIGAIAIIRTLGDPTRPTIGEAIRSAMTLLLPLLGAQLLAGLAIQVLPTLGNLSGNVPLSAIANLIGLPLLIYLSIKFLLISPVVALENTRNPLTALRRSWALTKGSSFRLLAFFVLLLLAFVVLFFVAAILIGLVLALLSEGIAQVGMAIFYAAIITLAYVVAYAVITAIYRQLASAPTSAAGVPTTADE